MILNVFDLSFFYFTLYGGQVGVDGRPSSGPLAHQLRFGLVPGQLVARRAGDRGATGLELAPVHKAVGKLGTRQLTAVHRLTRLRFAEALVLLRRKTVSLDSLRVSEAKQVSLELSDALKLSTYGFSCEIYRHLA